MSRKAVDPKAEELYDLCAQRNPGTVFYQRDLESFNIADDTNGLTRLCQELVDAHLFKVLTSDSGSCYQIHSREDATKLSAMDPNERLLYNYIDSSTTSGMWTKTLKARSNLHQSLMTRSLKSLESKALIKEIRSVKTPKRKIYMLAQYEPSEEVSGGPWHTDGELDVELVDTLAGVIMDYVRRESWAEMDERTWRDTKLRKKAALNPSTPVTSKSSGSGKASATVSEPYPGRLKPPLGPHRRPLVPRPPDFTRYPNAGDILKHVNATGIVEGLLLRESDFRVMLDMLEFDGRLERIGPTGYRAARLAMMEDRDNGDGGGGGGPGNGLSEAPCGRCPVFNLCEEGGPVSAGNCVYFDDWLKW